MVGPAAVWAAFAALPPDQRLALAWAATGVPYRTIAAALGTDPAGAADLVYQARESVLAAVCRGGEERVQPEP